MLRAHMPELVPAYERVVELAGGGDLAARMLSLYRPPPYLAACSQGVWSRTAPRCSCATTTTRPRAWRGSSGRRGCATPRHRDERLPVGPARRHERRGPRGVAHVRRAARPRRRVRHPARRPLPAGDVRRRRVGEGVARAAAVRARAQPDAGRSRRRRADRVPLARPRAVLPHVPAATNHQGIVEWPEQARATRTIERERCILDLLGTPGRPRRVVRGRVPAVPALQHGVRQRFRDACTRLPTGPPTGRWTTDGRRSRGGWGSTRSPRTNTPRSWPKGPSHRSPGRSFPDGRASTMVGWNTPTRSERGHHHGER